MSEKQAKLGGKNTLVFLIMFCIQLRLVGVIHIARTQHYACHEATLDFVRVKSEPYPHAQCLTDNCYKTYYGKTSLQKHFVERYSMQW